MPSQRRMKTIEKRMDEMGKALESLRGSMSDTVEELRRMAGHEGVGWAEERHVRSVAEALRLCIK